MSAPRINKFEQVLRSTLKAPKGFKFKDQLIFGRCAKCGGMYSMAQCSVSAEDILTFYRCPQDLSTLVIIEFIRPNTLAAPWPGRGYRLDKFVIRNAVDVIVGVGHGRGGILLERREHALAPESERPIGTAILLEPEQDFTRALRARVVGALTAAAIATSLPTGYEPTLAPRPAVEELIVKDADAAKESERTRRLEKIRAAQAEFADLRTTTDDLYLARREEFENLERRFL